MSTPFIDLAGACEKMVRYAGDLAKTNYPFELGRSTGMIDSLLDPANGSIKLDLNNTQAGKKFVKSKVVYKVRAKACEILEDDDVPSICEDGTEPAENSVDVTINKHLSSPVISFDNAKMVNICQDTEAFMKEYAMSYMRALRERVSEYLLAQADAAIGRNRHQNGDADTPAGSYKTKQLLGTSSDTGTMVPLYANYTDVKLDYQHNQFTGLPRLVGEGNLQKFMELSKYSCCNAPGVAYDSAVANAGAAFYLDQAANSILGSNNFLSFAPNLLHVLWFNENNNINIQTPTEAHIVVPDPVYPKLKWDYDFRWDCAKTWNFKISAWLDLFSLVQDDSFGEDSASPSPACEDELVGVTGVFGYKATAS
jgi:hypothetical protein